MPLHSATGPIQQLVEKRPSDNKGRLKLVVGCFTFLLAYIITQKIFFSTKSFEKAMMATASEINKTCPFMVDQYTRLDNTVAMSDNSFQYNYTIVSNEKSEIKIDTIKKYVVPGLINNVKTNPGMKIFRDHKTTVIYNCRDKNGVFVYKFRITPDMYK
jgi:hypothetical protein